MHLDLWREQRLLFMLAVNIDQPAAQFRHLMQWNKPSIHVHPAPPLPGQNPTKQEILRAFRQQIPFFQFCENRRVV